MGAFWGGVRDWIGEIKRYMHARLKGLRSRNDESWSKSTLFGLQINPLIFMSDNNIYTWLYRYMYLIVHREKKIRRRRQNRSLQQFTPATLAHESTYGFSRRFSEVGEADSKPEFYRTRGSFTTIRWRLQWYLKWLYYRA